MIKYRIKTEQEFLDEYGSNWRRRGSTKNSCYFNPKMDYLLGTELTNYTDYGDCFTIRKQKKLPNGDFGIWVISKDMLKEINIINYNDRKTLVYD